MFNALQTPAVPAQPLSGVASRLARRIGGAVRNAIAGSLSLAGALRRPAAPRTPLGHTLAEDAGARPEPRQAPCARHPRTTSPARPSHPERPGRLVRLLSRTPRHLVPLTPAPFSPEDNSPFTPENMPGLLPEAAAFFNTPLEDLDPALLRFSLRAFAEKLAELLPPETGLADADDLFADLRARFAAFLDEPDAPPSQAPLTPADPTPPAQRASPAAPPQPTPPARPEALPPVLLSSPPPSPEAQAPHPPAHPAATIAAALPAAPDTAFVPAPISPDHPQALGHTQALAHTHSFRLGSKPVLHRCRQLLRACRAAFRRFLVRTRVLRHWCYAARASPA